MQHAESTRSVIDSFNEAFNRHDVDAIMALMTSDCVFENTYPPPDGARHEGQAALRRCWQELFAGSPRAHFAWEDVWVAGDRGVVRWTYHWVEGDGRTGHVRGVDILRVRDGKVSEKLSYVKG